MILLPIGFVMPGSVKVCPGVRKRLSRWYSAFSAPGPLAPRLESILAQLHPVYLLAACEEHQVVLCYRAGILLAQFLILEDMGFTPLQ